ncbi:MAG: phage major capsid protein [Campylobacteraceae bacterium]|jgi:HK97 family phage major capsid protein/HK97 family phage prohead protease|nr:phage major capsid protein [Campylobacteraceae bacterium]
MAKEVDFTARQNRAFVGDCEIRSVDEDKMSVEVSFSSEEPYQRWFGYEILSHKEDAVDLSRLNDGAALLADHDTSRQIGVVERAWIQDNRGKAIVRFSKHSPLSLQIYNEVKDGIRKKISVGYKIDEAVLTQTKDDVDTWTVTKWQPLEISSVAVPADNSVGVGRGIEEKPYKEKKMDIEQIDTAAVEKAAADKERTRVAEIFAIGRQFDKNDIAIKAVEDGTDVDTFRKSILDSLKPGQVVQTKGGSLDLSDKEVKQYSFIRLLRALAEPQNRTAQDAATYEFEVSAEAQKRSGVQAKGVLVPFDVLGRDMTVSGAGGGGYTVPSDLRIDHFIELLKNRSAVLPYAKILTGLSGDIEIPVQLTSSQIQNLTEIGAITDSDITFGQKTLSPKRVGGSVPYSKRLVLQSALSVEQFIQADLLQQIALKIDWNLLNADGTGNTPVGIRNTAGINLIALGTNGAVPTFKDFVAMETLIAVDNADFGGMHYLLNAQGRGFVKTTPKESGFPLYIGDGGLVNGYSYIVSNQVPSNLVKGTGQNLSSIVFGNFSELIVGFWGGIDIVVDPYSKKKTAELEVTVNQFYDAIVRHPEAFTKIDDAKF